MLVAVNCSDGKLNNPRRIWLWKRENRERAFVLIRARGKNSGLVQKTNRGSRFSCR